MENFEQYLRGLEAERGLPANILSAVAHAETGGLKDRDNARSTAGAMGMFQFMPQTAVRFKVDPRDRVQAARGAADYLAVNRELFKRTGIDPSIENLVASYNAGEGAVTKYNGVPPYKETEGYVKKIMDFLVKPAGAADFYKPITDPEQIKRIMALSKRNSPAPQDAPQGMPQGLTQDAQPAAAEEGPAFKLVTDPELIHSLLSKSKRNKPVELEYTPAQPPGDQLQTAAETVADAGVGIGMGASLGWGEDLAGSMAKNALSGAAIPHGMDAFIPAPQLPEGVTPESVGEEVSGMVQDRYKLAKERSPVATTIGEIGGGMATGAAVPGGTLTSLGRMMGIGGLEGAVAGAGYADEGGAKDRMQGAALGGTIGAAAGPVLAGLGTFLNGALRSARHMFWQMPKTDARRLVSMAASRDMIDEGQAKALLDDLGDRAILADLGPNLASAGRDAAAQPGPGKTLAINRLADRQEDSVGDVARAAGVRLDVGDDLGNYLKAVDANRKAQAKPLYEEAFTQWIKPTPTIQKVLGSDAGQRALAKSLRTMSNDIDLPQLERAAVNEQTGEMSLRLLDKVKQSLFDMEDAARKGASDVGTNEARQIANIRRALTKELDQEAISPAYSEARRIYSGESALMDAGELGRQLFTGRKFATDIEDQISSMNKGELEALRIGVLRGMEDVIDSSNSNADIARQLIKSKRARDLIGLAFKGRDEEAQRFIKDLDSMSQMKSTKNVVDPNVNSQTELMRIERQASDAALGVSGAVLQGAMSGQYGPVMSAVMRFLSGTPKVTPEIAHEVINMLTSEKLTKKEIGKILAGTQRLRKSGGGAVTGLATGSGIGGGLYVEDQQPDLNTMGIAP